MYLFYVPRFDGGDYLLPEEESRHCVKVLRLAAGDCLSITDGRGGLFLCRVVRADAKRCEITCVERTKGDDRRAFGLHVAVAPTKNIERFEWFLEKCTEVGIDEVTPLLCDRSERRIIHPDRLEKIIVAAMKQSLKTYLPALHPLTPVREFLRRPRESSGFIAHCGEGERQPLHRLYSPGRDAVILIGPEGDFSPDEIRLAADNGFLPVSLGQSRLRTETAGIVACHTIHLVNAMER
ncbi:MAG: 16S rRNA (uracil(1498)-N(3))-methyltransferase [Odoribacteraceae bacterium]|jgi:16S rRNA (uracil1498-N3)-methyltransferase|nr:16S rRNA (uracil(1498)-N(3))-methyltransferase [Odoribacteraceae bacterium]